jgi:hypothetical protein
VIDTTGRILAGFRTEAHALGFVRPRQTGALAAMPQIAEMNTRTLLSLIVAVAHHRIRAAEGRPFGGNGPAQAQLTQLWRCVAHNGMMALRHLTNQLHGELHVRWPAVNGNVDPLDLCIELANRVRDPTGDLGMALWCARDVTAVLAQMRELSRGLDQW